MKNRPDIPTATIAGRSQYQATNQFMNKLFSNPKAVQTSEDQVPIDEHALQLMNQAQITRQFQNQGGHRARHPTSEDIAEKITQQYKNTYGLVIKPQKLAKTQKKDEISPQKLNANVSTSGQFRIKSTPTKMQQQEQVTINQELQMLQDMDHTFGAKNQQLILQQMLINPVQVDQSESIQKSSNIAESPAPRQQLKGPVVKLDMRVSSLGSAKIEQQGTEPKTNVIRKSLHQIEQVPQAALAQNPFKSQIKLDQQQASNTQIIQPNRSKSSLEMLPRQSIVQSISNLTQNDFSVKKAKKKKYQKSNQGFDDVASDDSGCTPMGKKFQSFVSNNSRPSSNASLRSNNSQIKVIRHLDNKSRLVVGSGIHENNSNDEDSEEDTSNLVVTNYDDWLAQRANQSQHLQNQPSRQNVLQVPVQKQQAYMHSIEINQSKSPRDLSGNNRAQGKFMHSRASELSILQTVQNSPRSQLGKSVNQVQPKQELVLPVISVPIKASQSPKSNNQTITCEDLKLAAVTTYTPRRQVQDDKIEKYQLSLLQNNSPRFLLRNQSQLVSQNDNTISQSPQRTITQQYTNLNKLDSNQSNANTNIMSEPIEYNKSQRQISQDPYKVVQGHDTYYVERSVNIRNRKLSRQDGSQVKVEGYYFCDKETKTFTDNMIKPETQQPRSVQQSRKLKSQGGQRFHSQNKDNLLQFTNTNLVQNQKQVSDQINLSNHQHSYYDTQIQLQRNGTSEQQAQIQSSTADQFFERRKNKSKLHNEFTQSERQVSEHLRVSSQLENSNHKDKQFNSTRITTTNNIKLIQSNSKLNQQVLDINDQEYSSDSSNHNHNRLKDQSNLQKQKNQNIQVVKEINNKPITVLNQHQIQEEQQIEQIEQRLALMKVSGAIKSKYSADNFVTKLKQFGAMLDRSQLKMFVLDECKDEMLVRRVTDADVEGFLKSFDQMVKVKALVNSIYGQVQSFEQKRQSIQSDDETTIGGLQTGQAQKLKVQRNKVDFEPEQASNSKKHIKQVQATSDPNIAAININAIQKQLADVQLLSSQTPQKQQIQITQANEIQQTKQCESDDNISEIDQNQHDVLSEYKASKPLLNVFTQDADDQLQLSQGPIEINSKLYQNQITSVQDKQVISSPDRNQSNDIVKQQSKPVSVRKKPLSKKIMKIIESKNLTSPKQQNQKQKEVTDITEVQVQETQDLKQSSNIDSSHHIQSKTDDQSQFDREIVPSFGQEQFQTPQIEEQPTISVVYANDPSIKIEQKRHTQTSSVEKRKQHGLTHSIKKVMNSEYSKSITQKQGDNIKLVDLQPNQQRPGTQGDAVRLKGPVFKLKNSNVVIDNKQIKRKDSTVKQEYTGETISNQYGTTNMNMTATSSGFQRQTNKMSSTQAGWTRKPDQSDLLKIGAMSSQTSQVNDDMSSKQGTDRKRVVDGSRLYNQETIASKLKRNERLAYEAKKKEEKLKLVRKKKPATSIGGKSVVGLSVKDDNISSDSDEQLQGDDEPIVLQLPFDSKHQRRVLKLNTDLPMHQFPIEDTFNTVQASELLLFEVPNFDDDNVMFKTDLPTEWLPISDTQSKLVDSDQLFEPHELLDDQLPDNLQVSAMGWYPVSEITNASLNLSLDEPHELDDEQLQPNDIQTMLEMLPIQGKIDPPQVLLLYEPHSCEFDDILEFDVVEQDLCIDIPPQWDGSTSQPELVDVMEFFPKWNSQLSEIAEEDEDYGSENDIVGQSDTSFDRDSNDSYQNCITNKSNQDSQDEQSILQQHQQANNHIDQVTNDIVDLNNSSSLLPQLEIEPQLPANLEQSQLDEGLLDINADRAEKQNNQQTKVIDTKQKIVTGTSTQTDKPLRRKKRKQDYEILALPQLVEPMQKPVYYSVSNSCQANFQDDECSDADDIYESYPGKKPNMVDCGLQTSNIHFTKITSSVEFKAQQEDKAFSTDWSLSSIYDELQFKKVIGKQSQTQTENCGNQVEEKQIQQETSLQILSQIECEYNAEMLKHSNVSSDVQTIERTFQLYVLGLNTLQALMYVLRLQKEWETVTRPQYAIDIQLDGSINQKALKKVDTDQCIKLLIRCKKMYEAKQAVMRLLKLVIEKDNQVNSLSLINDKQAYQSKVSHIRKLGARIATSINNLQDEHRIMKRPFILKGKDYLEQIQVEQSDLESMFQNNYFVDEAGTVGNKYQ